MKTIKEMPEHSRPREKLREKGAAALTDEKLVAAILGRGVEGVDIVTMSKNVARLIQEHKEKLSIEHLTAVPGMGLAKAAQILSAFELARRHLQKDTVKISGEYFVCITLNGANEVIEKRIITIGLLNSSQIHPREVFADAIADRAAAVILAHNHPSGDLKPSSADAQSHRRLTDAGNIVGIRILDHIIVSKKGYFSFQESGLIG